MPGPSPVFNRPTSLKIYDDQNEEHFLVDSLGQEFIQIQSPRMYYFRMNLKETMTNTDDLSTLYGETEQLRLHEPVEIFALVEHSPIIQELTKLGLAINKEISVVVNIREIETILGGSPNSGDFVLMYTLDDRKKAHRTFYKVASVNEIDLVLSRYTNYSINCEQTDLGDVDDSIREFLVREID